MTDKQKELFSRYTDAVREYQTMAECLLFQNSFKLGTRIIPVSYTHLDVYKRQSGTSVLASPSLFR